MEEDLTIEITCGDLAVIKAGSNDRLSLSALDMNSHVHGALLIKIQDRYVPYLGYWGANHICFSDWIRELENIYREFSNKETASYIFDEGEQGQPAFLFEKDSDTIRFSIVDSQLSDGEADEEWQRVAFSYSEFVAQYEKFFKQFVSGLKRAAPSTADQWIEKYLPRPG
jgi:hypothetical protein